MRIKETEIEGLLVIEGVLFKDLRGALIKPFSKSFFNEFPGLNLDIKETWFTRSHVDVIRAMHLQVGEFACEKIVSVIQGAVIDVILDTRKSSKTFKKWFELELNEDSSVALYIPKGCAHGYKVIRENTLTMYMATEVNVPKDDVGIRYDSFGYDWKIDHPVLSEKDKNLPPLSDFV
ncbi:MAG: dTDP-4-dehydrorhamnose 3,5-epimerase family protein [Methanomicrobiales archaeon]